MPSRPQVRTKGVVLRRTNYSEADRIVQFLTPDNGKISVIAKAVRREKSKLAGGIELFAICDITVIPGKGEMGTLTSARLDVFFSNILKDYERMQLGYEMIKQVSRATETVSEPAFYALIEVAYRSLNDVAVDLRITETWFWLQLAILQGVGLNLSRDAAGAKLLADTNYEFDLAESSLVPKPNGRFTADHIKLLRLLSAQSPQVVAQVSGAAGLLNDCLWLGRQAAAH